MEHMPAVIQRSSCVLGGPKRKPRPN